MAVQTIDTYKGYETRVIVYIKEDGSGAAPADWAPATAGDGMTLIGIATDVSCSASTEVTDITGLNQQTPYNTKAGNITYEWSLDQFFTTTKWQDDAATPNEYHPLEMISSGKKFAMQIAQMNGKGETATAEECEIELTQCTVSNDEATVSGSDGDLTISMSGSAAARNITVAS
jgi:hypothetical protein